MIKKIGLFIIMSSIFFHPILSVEGQNPTTVLRNEIFDQWQNKAISFTPAVTRFSQGSSSVVVVIIDSGIDFNHYDLGNQLKYNNPGEIPKNGIDDDHNGYIDDTYGWNFVSNNNNMTPVPLHIDANHDGIIDGAISHGTAIAGIIAGQGKDVLGIVPKIKIMDVKIYNSDGVAYSVEKAFSYVYNLTLQDPRIKVINFSGVIEGSGNAELNATLTKLLNHNISIVAAAGNNYNKGDYNVSYPADFPGVISVGSIDKDLQISSFSQRGSNLDFVAPGENVFSLSINNQINNNLDGTSFSAPYYTAAIAFLYSLHFKTPLTPSEIFSILKNSTTDLGAPGWDPTYGYGLLNMTKLVQIVKPLIKTILPIFNVLSIIFPVILVIALILLKPVRKIKDKRN